MRIVQIINKHWLEIGIAVGTALGFYCGSMLEQAQRPASFYQVQEAHGK